MPKNTDRTTRNRIAQRARHLPFTAIALMVAACTAGIDQDTADPTTTTAPSTASTAPSTAPSTSSTAAPSTTTPSTTTANLVPLPERPGPREETTLAVPHVQVFAEPVPEVDAELRRRAFSLPGVEELESQLSVPGTRSLWLADDIELARPEILLAGREFAHIHPNGSLHIWLPTERAFEVAETKWGELHPFVGRDDFWNGMAMLYTPETLDELDITMLLIVDAYNFVTGANLDPEDFS